MREGIVVKIPDSHRFPKHSAEISQRFKDILAVTHNRRNLDLSKEVRASFNIKKHTVIPLNGLAKSPTITTLPDDYIHYEEPRILTVREYARIQSFPDWYIFQGKLLSILEHTSEFVDNSLKNADKMFNSKVTAASEI